MEFKVPQNVQREDTIFGPVTFKQLGILLIGGGLSYVIYLVLARNNYTALVWGPAAGIPGLITLIVAFVKIQDMTFSKAFMYFLELILKPRNRFYSTNNLLYKHSFAKEPIFISLNQKKIEAKKENKLHKIDELSNLLDK